MRSRFLAPITGALLLAGTSLAFSGTASADTLNGINNADWSQNGSAYVTGSTLVVTTTGAHEIGSGFYYQPVNISESWEASFSETVANSNVPGVSGAAFVLQNDPSGTSAMGGQGPDLGYACGLATGENAGTCSTSNEAISPSAVVELDGYVNPGETYETGTPTAPYAAFTEDGNPSSHFASGGYSFNGNDMSSTGATNYFWVDYNARTQQLSVYENSTDSKPATPLFTQTVNLVSVLGKSTAYIGFTGATSSNYATQEFSNFSFNNYEGYTTVPGGGNAYDIESANPYCTGGGSSCVPANSTVDDCMTYTVACPGLNYGDVEAFGPPNGSASGTPEQIILICAHGTSTGYDYGALDVQNAAGATDYPNGVYSEYPDLGSITGTASVAAANPASLQGSEMNPAQQSSANISGFDNNGGYSIRGTAYGVQNTDNGSDTLNSGGFTVTLSGYLTYQPLNGSPSYYKGTISCNVGGTHANDLLNAGVDSGSTYAEGEIEPVIGDNFFAFGLPSTVTP